MMSPVNEHVGVFMGSMVDVVGAKKLFNGAISRSITAWVQIVHPCRRIPMVQDPRGVLCLLYQVPSEPFSISPAIALRYLPIVGVQRFTSLVWYHSITKLKGVLAHWDPSTPLDSRQPHWFLPEIVEMIIAHHTYDASTLKACAATCSSWYNVAAPRLHHTLTLRRQSTDISHKHLNPLAPLDKLGLLPFVKQVQFEEAFSFPWVVPSVFNSQTMPHFGALVNLQDLTIADLDFSKFPMGLGEYFGHFSPTLRSVALNSPKGSRRPLLDFFRLFPRLDDIKISHYHDRPNPHEELDCQLIPMRGGLRGRLVLKGFDAEGLSKDIIVAFGGMRFTSMDLRSVRGVQLLLEACADTLETVNIFPVDTIKRSKRVLDLRGDFPTLRLMLFFASASQKFRFLAEHCPSISRSLTTFDTVETHTHHQRTPFHHCISHVRRARYYIPRGGRKLPIRGLGSCITGDA